MVVGKGQRYRYVGPSDVRSVALQGDEGYLVQFPSDFDRWITTIGDRDLAEPFTYVVDVEGVLRLAPRHSEHVACARGCEVLGAGEVMFVRQPVGWVVSEITNQSTGYCPDPGSWPAVAAAVERAGLAHPGGFTSLFVFRRCPRCQERNVVKDGDFVCAVCGGELPAEWNVDALPPEGGP